MATVELLAPAGSIETFRAALDGGADAIYVGAPGFNARNLARDLRLEEIGAMIRTCHTLGKKLFVAANSLVLERELPLLIENLALLQELKPDGLIVQDLGLIRLVNNHFPRLRLHASTLMLAHNSEAVKFLASLGCRRVVLARELTMQEIAAITSQCAGTEIEVFVHGAMCFSYSGLCLFSSYLGGKSGLRGRCVQPCRRAYSSGSQNRGHGKKTDSARYLFSMNDLSGLDVLPALVQTGITSLKIEGRLRSAGYVQCIVGAYRRVLDAAPDEQERAIVAAKAMADQAMTRKTSLGYFLAPQPAEAITPYHSGNMGIHLGRFTTIKMAGEQQICRFVLKGDLAVGDRLRLHCEPSGERIPYRLKTLFVAGVQQEHAASGCKVSIALPPDFLLQSGGHVEVYKIDGSGGSAKANLPALNEVARELVGIRKKLSRTIDIIRVKTCGREEPESLLVPVSKGKIGEKRGVRQVSKKGLPLEWWLKTDSVKALSADMLFSPDRFLLAFTKQNLSQAGKIKTTLGGKARMIVWALPPLIMEGELSRFHKQIVLLMRTGFRTFQLGHISQAMLFGKEKVQLFADYTCNLLNSQAMALAGELGFSKAQALIEADREALRDLLADKGISEFTAKEERGARRIPIGLTVYGAPALYTSRLAASHFHYDRQILSPKKEAYVIKKVDGGTQTFPEKPFSLLPYIEEIRDLGVSYVIVDISGDRGLGRGLQELQDRIANTGRYGKLPTFNYLGKLE
jgi:U32 family peptidase